MTPEQITAVGETMHCAPGWEGMGDDGVRRRVISVDPVPLYDARGTVLTTVLYVDADAPSGQFRRCTMAQWRAYLGLEGAPS